MSPTPHAQALGRAVHSVIREAGLNITETSTLSGIPRRTMSRGINGERCFDFDDLAKLAPVLACSPSGMVARAERILAERAA